MGRGLSELQQTILRLAVPLRHPAGDDPGEVRPRTGHAFHDALG